MISNRLLQYFLLVLSTLFISELKSQKIHDMDLLLKGFDVPGRHFYINEVTDVRGEIYKVGFVTKGTLNTTHIAVFKNGLAHSLSNHFDIFLPKTTGNIPIDIEIINFEIKEDNDGRLEICVLNLEVVFYHDGEAILSYSKEHTLNASKSVRKHSENIHQGLTHALKQLNDQVKERGLDDEFENEDEYLINNSNKDLPASLISKDVKTIGYQIGGLNIIGFDYEARISDRFGIHVGAGVAGFTVGAKVHTGPEKMSPFFNFSFKDAGFGLLDGVGVEYGGRLALSEKSDLSLTTQVGLLKITQIEDSFKATLFGDENAPEFIMAFGIGLSW